MELNKTYTLRGFELVEFKDFYGYNCSIQKSSLAEEDAIWIGVTGANPKIMDSQTLEWGEYSIPEDVLLTTRMHLTRKQVKELLPILKQFVKTGNIFE